MVLVAREPLVPTTESRYFPTEAVGDADRVAVPEVDLPLGGVSVPGPEIEMPVGAGPTQAV